MERTPAEISKLQELIYELTVEQVMSKGVVVCGPDDTMDEVKELMRINRVSGIPVVEGDKLVGLVSLERVIKTLEAGETDVAVHEKMTREVRTVSPREALVHTVDKFGRYKYGRFPVVDGDGRLVGILTKGDIVRGLLKALEVDYHQEESARHRASHLFEDVISDETTLVLRYRVVGRKDFKRGGEAASRLKRTLKMMGIRPNIVRRVGIAVYEAEMNVVIHADGGQIVAELEPRRLMVRAIDHGPGIADVEQALQPGFSTAPEWARELGFGAGMGLSNIQHCADELHLESVLGQGTDLEIIFNL